MKNHLIINTIITLKGNPRACVYTEPLWVIPFVLYTPFVSVYMAALGLTDTQIGTVASVSMFCMALSAIMSGAITDKLGRKKTTFIFDMLSWSVPALIWAFSQNFAWFIAGAVFNGMLQVTANSWTCLLIEDAKKDAITTIYSILHLINQSAVVFAPLSVYMISRFTIIPVMRVLFIITFIMMTTKFFLLNKLSHETEVGMVRRGETAHESVFHVLLGYGSIFRRLFASKPMMLALIVSILFNITGMISGSFFGLYTTGPLALPEHFLGFFPIVRSLVVVFFLFFVQSHLLKLGFKRPMLAGVLLYIAGLVILLLSPSGNIPVIFLYIFIEACAFSLVMPNKDSMVAILIDADERARISSIMTFLVLCCSMPFGYLAGRLSDIDRRFPFLLIGVLFIFAFTVILIGGKHADKRIE